MLTTYLFDTNVTYSEHHGYSETPTTAIETSIKVCDDVIDNEEVIESSIVACYICPECGRKTNSKKQLYRHAAQVRTSKIYFVYRGSHSDKTQKWLYGQIVFTFVFMKVHFSHQLLRSYELQIVGADGECPICGKELNMASDQRDTLIGT